MNIGFIIMNQIFSTNFRFKYLTPTEFNISDYFLNIEINYNKKMMDKLVRDDIENIENIKNILAKIINNIPSTKPVEFEKDDDELGHVIWINISANIRNIQYSIEQTDLYETRRISGNIIPAMITTTALISGFQVLEYIRLLKFYQKDIEETTDNKIIDRFKNRFVNLNINYCDGINPSPTKKFKLNNNQSISVWTNFKTNSINTREIIEQIQNETNKKIEFMTCGNETIYDGDEIYKEQLDKTKLSNCLILLEDIPIGFFVLFNE
jgi:hypothetical protein